MIAVFVSPPRPLDSHRAGNVFNVKPNLWSLSPFDSAQDDREGMVPPNGVAGFLRSQE
ncbi:MAG: hypothetical protein U9N55_03115 [candidate division Zixibacteria bacterium]|nr:hypothetical protein [candidate division Zixibacteria bacterium]